MNRIYHKPSNTIRLSAGRDEDIKRAIAFLLDGKLVALPTETVYGLAGNGLSSHVIKKIFSAKMRPAKNPLILHVHDIASARSLFDLDNQSPVVAQRFTLLADAFWPGPLTIIAKKAPHIPSEATAGLDTAAVRVPDSITTRKILQHLPFPLVMPSANLSTRPSPTCVEHVLATLDGRIDAVLNDGPCSVGIESTVIKIDDDKAMVLRPGLIDTGTLSQALGEEVIDVNSIYGDAPISPGTSFLHYSPAVKAVHVCTDRSTALAHWTSAATFFARKCDYEDMEKQHGCRPLSSACVILPDQPQDFAKQLYCALYQAERLPENALVILLPQASPSWNFIIDRLIRAERTN